MKRAFRLIPVALFAALAVAASGCGSNAIQTSSSSESGAKFVRSGVLAFVALNTDLESRQWQQLDDLAKKFPGRDKVLQRIDGALAKHGVDLQDDVEPALGPEVDIAVALGAGGRDTAVVALTKPDDPDKFKALVAKLNAADEDGKPVVYRVVEGWYALSDKQTSIDRVLTTGGQTLADDSTFKDAQAQLPGDALLKTFVDGQQIDAAVKQAAQGKSSALGASSLGLDKLGFIAASTSVEDDGLRVHGATGGNAAAGSDFAAKLLGNVPGDALAVLDFRGAGIADRIEKLRVEPEGRPRVPAGRGSARRLLRGHPRPSPQRGRPLRAPGSGDPGSHSCARDEGPGQGPLDSRPAGGQARGGHGRAAEDGDTRRPRGEDARPRPVLGPLRRRRRDGRDHERAHRDLGLRRGGRAAAGQRRLQTGAGGGRDARLHGRLPLPRPEELDPVARRPLPR